jgi:hypothetical protein
MPRARTLLLALAALCLAARPRTLANPAHEVALQLQRAQPGAQLYFAGAQLQRVYGAPFGYGLSPEQSAENFVRTYSEAFGVPAVELLPGNLFNHQYTQPLLDAATGTSVATLVYYQQYHAGVPVYRSELRLLALNQPGYPLIWAGSSLHDLGDWQPTGKMPMPQEGAAHAAAAAAVPGLIAFGASEAMIWAGLDDQPAPPCLAVAFDADNGAACGTEPLKWHFVADAATGAILYQADRVVHTDVVGNVQGLATVGIPPKADTCNPETATAMRYAKVAIGGTTAYADANGNFTIPNGGTSPVTVTSYMSGQYFVVNDQYQAVETLSQVVTPPGPANFMHNAANTSQYIRAEVNAYIQANIVRDFALTQDPTYPTIAAQTNFPLYVNGSSACYSSYNGTAIYLNRAGSGCTNTAFSSIVHHEYGHHLVQCGGSGQGAYGEGMGDSVALLIADDPVFAYGLEGNCSAGVRDANNTLQYPCSGANEYCGQLLSGCVWSTRNELLQTNPTTYLQILAKLTVNSILLHTGTQITPAICADFLALDDAYYGGAHEAEILAGFAVHNLVPVFPPANDDCADAFVACPGEAYTGNTGSATPDGATTCGQSSTTPDVWYRYTPATSGTAVFSLCSGTNYDSAMSVHSGCPGTVGNTLACNDDGCGTPYAAPSEITLDVTVGITYVVRVTGWNESTGAYTFTVDGPDCGIVDCNGNGIPDDQDIASGTSNDDNGNGVPDECEQHIGDLNCDGSVNFGDINPFVLLLSNEAVYRTTFPNCIRINGDINGDGTYGQASFADINPFVALLSGR